MVNLSTSFVQKQYFSLSLAGKNICELWSIIFGLASNLILESKAFNLGMYSFYSYLFYFECFPFDFDFDFSLGLSYSILNLFFFVKYFVPLNYRVRVAEMKKTLLFNLSTIYFIYSFSSGFYYTIGVCFFFSFFPSEGSTKGVWPSIWNNPKGTSKSFYVSTLPKLNFIFFFFPF